MTQQQERKTSGRRGFFYTVFGGLVAALAGWLSGTQPRGGEATPGETSTPVPTDSRIAAMEAEVTRMAEQLRNAGATVPLGELEGEAGEHVVFNKSELTINNPEGVLLNLVAIRGHVGIRFYKEFGFGDEVHTNPWHLGYIERDEGYQGLAILRDRRFTAAL